MKRFQKNKYEINYINSIKMLYHDRTDVNKGIDVNEVGSFKECIIL